MAITRAPASLANSSANTETPPEPCTSTVSPGRTSPWCTTALQAVRPAQGRAAASASVRWLGAATSASAGSAMNSCMTPSIGPPSALAKPSWVGGPDSQPGKKLGQTRSPALNRVTPAPTATTSPTPSETGITGRRPPRAP